MFSVLNGNPRGSSSVDPDLVKAIRRFGRTEQGEPVDLSGWYGDYCSIVGREGAVTTAVSGCSQVGKSLAGILWGCQMAQRGYRMLYVLPTLTAMQRNLKVQVAPIARHWAIPTIGYQSWSCGKGALIFGYTSTSARAGMGDGLAEASGSMSALSVDGVIADELSQMTPEELAPVIRRMDNGRIESRPWLGIGTKGGGRGIERIMNGIDTQLWPLQDCQSCKKPFRLNPRECFILKTSEVGWIEEYSQDAAGNPAISCPNCRAVADKVEAYFENFTGKECAIHLTPLLRKGDPAARIIDSQKIAMRNSASSPADFIQQVLGESSEGSNAGLLRIRLTDFDRPAIMESLTPIGRFAGVDQGIGQHYYCELIALKNDAGRMSFKILSLKTQSDEELLESLHQYRPDFALGDLAPDRTLMLNLSNELPALWPAQQKYTLQAFAGPTRLSVGSRKEQAFELPSLAFPVIFEASAAGRLQFLSPPSTLAQTHLTAVKYDTGRQSVIRPRDHNDDLMFALYFAVSAALIWDAGLV